MNFEHKKRGERTKSLHVKRGVNEVLKLVNVIIICAVMNAININKENSNPYRGMMKKEELSLRLV